jgi:hypothetical protein
MITGNFDDFNAQLGNILERYKGRMDSLVRTATFDLFEEIIRQTPGPGKSIQETPAPGTPTGFLRGSWYVFIGDGGGDSSAGKPDVSGGVSIATVNAALQKAKAGETIYFLNGAKYALRLEFGFVGTDSLGRDYNQAPRSFVRSSIAEFQTIVAAAAQRLQGGKVK